MAIVTVDEPWVCARCASGRGCGAGLFSGARSRRVEAGVPAGVEVREGDRVAIDLAPRNLLHAASIVYGWPLAAAAAGAAAAYLLQWSDTAAAASALAGVAAGVFAARRRLEMRECLQSFTPVVTERLATGRGA